jgi:hypothetical protein
LDNSDKLLREGGARRLGPVFAEYLADEVNRELGA